MALIELVDFNEIYSNGKTATAEKAKTTRRGRAKKGATKAEDTTTDVASTEEKGEE